MDGFDIDENDPISFDDLGKIYKSISRQRILSNVNVQCPNVHFHAHPDGSTTIHKHKSCPTPSLATLDPRRKTSNDSSKVRGPVNRGGKDNSYEIVSELTSNDVEEEVYSSLNDDPPSLKRSPQSMLGPLPVPPKALHSGGFKHHQSSGCECSSKEPVCDIEGGIKFNPCYLSKHDMVQGNDLCDVMLDAVWQAGHAAAVHAGKSKCMHCAHFTNKFNSEMKDIMQQNGNGNRSTSSGKGTTRSHNKHPRRDDFDTIERGGAPYGFYNPPNPMHASGPYLPRFPAVMPSKSRVSGQRSSPVDRSIKLMAYISVVVLAILLLIIVVILLIVFFQHHEF